MNRRFNTPNRFPNRTITLKPASKRNLPNPVPFLHPPFSLRVSQLIPYRTRRRVPEPVQRHSRRFNMLLSQLQVLLHLINNRPTTSMNTKMIKRHFKIRQVGFNLPVYDFSSNKINEKQ
ncbi:hypothetical protein HanIR_Chr10g0488131 [Helianthus annuus]|nr:hypothetical protein HanIR_Chr10g0488131 [Helianthus annuus]